MKFGEGTYGEAKFACTCRPEPHTHNFVARDWPSVDAALLEGADVVGLAQDEIRDAEGALLDTEPVLLVKPIYKGLTAIKLRDMLPHPDKVPDG